MIFKYLAGTKYSQSSIASDTGTTQTEGTYVYSVVQRLNNVLGNSAYRYVSISDINGGFGVLPDYIN